MRIIISVVVFVLLLFFETKAQQANMEVNYNPKETFMGQSLSSVQLVAFEKRATEKVQEFYQYLALVSDEKLDKKIRQQAKKQAMELFSGEDNSVYGVSLKKYLDSCANDKLTPLTDISDCKLKDNFTPQEKNESEYKALVSFLVGAGNQKKSATILLQRREKQFGKELKTIWVVTLKEIS